mmetsp:Transcript_24176/g.45962  ORF Transcript_24176/g.45962 Transcript_24176/m.45962 type:complete len:276 (-) Transcript_24176:398-1225(-)
MPTNWLAPCTFLTPPSMAPLTFLTPPSRSCCDRRRLASMDSMAFARPCPRACFPSCRASPARFTWAPVREGACLYAPFTCEAPDWAVEDTASMPESSAPPTLELSERTPPAAAPTAWDVLATPPASGSMVLWVTSPTASLRREASAFSPFRLCCAACTTRGLKVLAAPCSSPSLQKLDLSWFISPANGFANRGPPPPLPSPPSLDAASAVELLPAAASAGAAFILEGEDSPAWPAAVGSARARLEGAREGDVERIGSCKSESGEDSNRAASPGGE